MSRVLALIVFVVGAVSFADAQWTLQESHTKANLRGVFNVGGGTAWASGSGGTVLRTEDGGYLWQNCAVPPGAEKLDFRGIQAIDEQTAFVMSSGPGELSRLYQTSDGCRSWTLLFTNPDKDGFWDALLYDRASETLFILGDPVGGSFRLFSQKGAKGKFTERWNDQGIPAASGEAAFAASNSLLLKGADGALSFVTGGSRSEFIQEAKGKEKEWSRRALPFAGGSSSGAFSVSGNGARRLVVVGGDYQKPEVSTQTAAYSDDGGQTWHTSQRPPGGYRSAVAYYEAAKKTWIAVGPNGTDVSRDNGRTWKALTGDTAKNWNAVSLPYVVGPQGRIGKLRGDALKH